MDYSVMGHPSSTPPAVCPAEGFPLSEISFPTYLVGLPVPAAALMLIPEDRNLAWSIRFSSVPREWHTAVLSQYREVNEQESQPEKRAREGQPVTQ